MAEIAGKMQRCGRCAIQKLELTIAIRIHGAMTIPGEQQKAMEVLSHSNRFKPRFAKFTTAESGSGSDSIVAKLDQLAQLKERGLISSEEFEAKKRELL